MKRMDSFSALMLTSTAVRVILESSQEEISLMDIAKKHNFYVYSDLVKRRKQLEEHGYVTSRINEKDKRYRLIKITEKGKNFLEQLKAIEKILKS